MNAYTDVKTVTEIVVDHSNRPVAIRRLNAYLKAGWVLLDIHKRGYDYTHEGESSRLFSVYILGNAELDAPDPTKQEDNNRDISF